MFTPATDRIYFSECEVSVKKGWLKEVEDAPKGNALFGQWRGVFANSSGRGCGLLLITPMPDAPNMAKVRYCHARMLVDRCVYAEVEGIASGELLIAKNGRFLTMRLLEGGRMWVEIHRFADNKFAADTVFKKFTGGAKVTSLEQD
ncbi:MAG: hypothetical protein ISR99_01485 [Parcubacteria group bacterium]|nr:hypothetical protein [Parcubacteria group bacterium]